MQMRWGRFILALAAIGILAGATARWTGVGYVESAYAQSLSSDGGSADEDLKNKRPETFFDYWRQGGFTMYLLLIVAAWMTAMIIQLVMKMRAKYVSNPETIQQLYQTLSVKDYQKAWKIGMENPSVATRILCAALEKLPKGREAFDLAAMETASVEANSYKSLNAYISLNATISPLLGLFGTISGMVGAFNSMAFSGAVGDPSKLAGDIGEALITTYGGLVVAIPGLCVYYIFGNRIKTLMENVQTKLNTLFDEIDFDNIPADLVIVTKEMKMAHLGGALASKAQTSSVSQKAGTSQAKSMTPSPKAAPAPQTVACPNCSKSINVGDSKCQHCGTELHWE